MLTFALLQIWNTSFVAQYISDIKQIQGDTNLAIHLSRGRTLDGQKITAGMLQNPTALQYLV